MFLSSGDAYIGELLELPQGGKGPFLGSRGKEGFLSRRCRGKGPHFTLRGETHGLSSVAAGNLGFLLSDNGDLRYSLMLHQEIPISMRVARALSGFLSSRFRD